MAIALRPGTEVPYIPVADRQQLPQDKQTTFLLRQVPLSVRLLLLELEAATNTQRMLIVCRFLRAAVAGWRNFLDQDGKPVECEIEAMEVNGCMVKNALSARSIDHCDESLLAELFTAAIEVNKLTKAIGLEAAST